MQNEEAIDLLRFLKRFRDGKIVYRLSQHREDAIMVEVAVPGERWQVKFLEDGSVAAEVFRSDGEMHNETALDELVARHADAVKAAEFDMSPQLAKRG